MDKTKRIPNSDLLRLVALITMTVDHIGKLFYPADPLPQAIGRIAMPLFAYGIAAGVWRTTQKGTGHKYLTRLIIATILSQAPFALMEQATGCDISTLNILFTWTLSAAICLAANDLHLTRCRIVIAASFAAAILIPMDYGLYGIILCIVIWLSFSPQLPDWTLPVGMTAVTGLCVILGLVPDFQLLSLLAVPIIVIVQRCDHTNWRLPRWIAYGYYPVHFLILLAIKYLIAV